MNPWVHASNSARRYGGRPEDYLAIHQWMDSAKGHIGTVAHRLILHNSFGVQLAEQVHGDIVKTPSGYIRQPFITNSDGKQVFVRDIAQDHVKEDMGNKIPTLAELMAGLPIESILDRIGVFAPLIREAKKRLEASKKGESHE